MLDMTKDNTQPGVDLLQAMAAASPLAVVALDPDGVVTYWNPAAERLFGYASDDVLGRPLQIVPPGEVGDFRDVVHRVLDGEPLVGHETRRQTKDGRLIDVSVSTSAIHDQDGNVTGMAGFVEDISKRKRAEGRIARMVAGQHAVLTATDRLIRCEDADALHRMAVELARENLGLERCSLFIRDGEWMRGTYGTDMHGQTTFETAGTHRIAADARARRGASPDGRLWRAIETARHEWNGTGYEEMDPAWVVTTPVAVDGECVGVFYNDAAITGSPLDETEQDLLAVYCSILGRILERKAAEAALTESEARHRTLFESTRDAVMILDAEAFLDGNQATLDVFGCATREEFLGRHPGEVSPPKQPDGRDSRSVADERIATALREGSDHFEWLHCRVDGTEFPADVLLSRLDLGEGPMLQAVVRDITARKKAEEGTRQTSKLESIGALAGGVAHDFNNILTGIIGYADIMRDEGLVGSEGTQELATIRELADKAANLTRQLLAFSRQQPIETKILKPNELIHELTKLLGRVIGEDVRVQLNLAEGLHRISADAGQVQQVIMNLVVNARDAMPEGGTLTIETANVLLDEEYADSHVDVTPGGYVMLAISDSGHGMDAETQEHIFEPFFTTKEVGEGTGLGLATVYGIVKQHGGNIWVYSELGTGTTFKMYLPRATGEVDRTAPVASARADTARGEVVLLVEDDPTVRAIAQRTLVNQGYTVLVASNAGEAERVSTAHDDGITLLLSDVVMPGRTGPDLYESLAAQRPGLKVLFMSGYPKAAASNGVLRPDRPLLQKPFTPTSLAEKVREVLDGQDG